MGFLHCTRARGEAHLGNCWSGLHWMSTAIEVSRLGQHCLPKKKSCQTWVILQQIYQKFHDSARKWVPGREFGLPQNFTESQEAFNSGSSGVGPRLLLVATFCHFCREENIIRPCLDRLLPGCLSSYNMKATSLAGMGFLVFVSVITANLKLLHT